MAEKIQSDGPWFTLPTEHMGPTVQGIVDGYRNGQAGRRATYVRNLELYEQRPMTGYSAHSYYNDVGTSDFAGKAEGKDRLGLIRSAVSSGVAEIFAPQKPKPQFQTLGATWAVRRKAYRLDRICEGILNQRQGRWINMWAFMTDASVDALLQGVAPIWVTADKVNKRINHELVPLPDLFTDPSEGRTPKSLFLRRPMDESEACKRWPKHKEAIRGAKPYEWFGGARAQQPRAAKTLEIVYAWRLPLGPEDPGRWCAVINGAVVDEGEWTAPAFPFVFLLWEPHRDGFWASGVADEAARQAIECGELDLRLLYREIVASGKKIFYERDTVNPDDLALNDATVAVAVDPSAKFMPVESTPPPFNAMELDYLRFKVQGYWDTIGLSQVSAAARREPGLNSGIAIMTVNDTKAGRQLVKSQRYEQAFVDLAHQWVWRLRELAEDDPEFMVSWPGKTMMRQVKWTDADLEDDMFTANVAPASSLPHDPAGRQEMVSVLYDRGIISPETARQLTGWADVEQELDMSNAEAEYVDMLIEKYLDADQETWTADEYQAPEGFIMNKMGALRRFASAWFRARIDQAFLPKEERAVVEFNLDLLSRWMQELDALIQREAAAAQALAAPPGTAAPPGAAPAAIPSPVGVPNAA